MSIGLSSVGIAVSIAISAAGGTPALPQPMGVGVSPAARIAPQTPSEASRVVRAWDQDRRRAWEQLDEKALQALYTPGSRAGRRDVVMLRSWSDRRVRPVGWKTKVRSTELVARSRSQMVVCVVDRIHGGRAVGEGVRVDLPEDRWSSHLIEFRNDDDRWVVGAVETRACPRGR